VIVATLAERTATTAACAPGDRSLTREALALRRRLWRYLDRCPLERGPRAAALWHRAWARYERREARGL
jgi:hypothetical protein